MGHRPAVALFLASLNKLAPAALASPTLWKAYLPILTTTSSGPARFKRSRARRSIPLDER